MEYENFEKLLAEAGLSKKEFASLMGLNATSVTNYAAGNVPRHLAVIAVFCREFKRMGLDFHALIRSIPYSPKKYRSQGSPKGVQGELF